MSEHNDFAGEFVNGDIYGIRAWNIDSWGRLRGVSYPAIWTPGVNTAVCRRRYDDPATVAYGTPSTHDVAADDCGCGWWAYHDGDPQHTGHIQGVIRAWGDCNVGEKGFRAPKAEVVALCVKGVSSHRVELLKRNYPDVPLFGKRSVMLAEYPLSEQYSPSPDNTPDFWTREESQASFTFMGRPVSPSLRFVPALEANALTMNFTTGAITSATDDDDDADDIEETDTAVRNQAKKSNRWWWG